MSSNVQTISKGFLACSTAMFLASVLAVSTAFADGQVRSETVKFQDLNVSTSAGVQALYGRIHAAARRVCVSAGNWAPISELACARKAEAQAIAKLDLPLLTAYYRMKTGGKTDTRIANR
jgi:UrcA family protein